METLAQYLHDIFSHYSIFNAEFHHVANTTSWNMVSFQNDEVFLMFTKDVLIFMLSHQNIDDNNRKKKYSTGTNSSKTVQKKCLGSTEVSPLYYSLKQPMIFHAYVEAWTKMLLLQHSKLIKESIVINVTLFWIKVI